ncbi:DUF1754-domain-containing protein [Hypoxylon rubiginosum]|uniref:DUF1754-domain-containing protein n=1 Tax=Hypoxylon rubiginosum TaxID=110542 RepID=A0ACB9YIB8_9PEZI|nr:DUF1754-domain-containing protein [Hypoxylon rubiginosum]
MPADDYASVGGGGALKLKGGKVQKTKKKKKSKAPSLEQSLSAGDDSTSKETERAPRDDGKNMDEGAVAVAVAERKTEAERRHEEANKKKMMKMLEDPKLASEFRKTHKERVEGLNTYLSKLSEHHDMPKIGPG